MSRTVNGEHLFDDVAKEVLRKQCWQIAEYCGLQLVTYAILANHFHVLVRVPRIAAVGDAELLRRYQLLYPRPTRHRTQRIEVVRQQLAADHPEAAVWRRRQLAMMGDISPFMKLLKQRFSIWFNQTHQRFGTLWSERFKSVLVEPRGRAVEAVAAYVDLNAVRAGWVDDPKDYRFCGYAEAVAGGSAAQQGINSLFSLPWRASQAGYRQILFGTGVHSRAGRHLMPYAAVQEALQAGGQLPLATVLRCRVRYFSDGAVLGSRAFVARQLAHYHRHTGWRTRASPRPLPSVTRWTGLCTLRTLRQNAFG